MRMVTEDCSNKGLKTPLAGSISYFAFPIMREHWVSLLSLNFICVTAAVFCCS